MNDFRIDKLANLLVNYSVAVQPGQKVIIRGSTIAEPLITSVYVKVLEAGGFPLVWASLPGMDELLLKYGNDEQIEYVPDPLKLVVETFDAQIAIMGSLNTRSLSGVDPTKMVLRNRAQQGIMQTFLDRAAQGKLHWTGTLFPTQAYAQEAEMSLSDYEDFVYGACLPDLEDPVAYWKKFSASQQKIIEWLNGKNEVHILGPDTDLRLSVRDRTFINCDCHENVPDGEIFTGPVEDSVNGMVYFSYPAIYQGREVSGVRLWFENGRVVKAAAQKNEEFLLNVLDTDAGARYVGEFAIGTNDFIQKFTGQILFDEKIGGSFHIALGAGYPETGSRNVSSIHWDMICDLRAGGEIWIDGELLYQNGKFTIPF